MGGARLIAFEGVDGFGVGDFELLWGHCTCLGWPWRVWCQGMRLRWR